MNAVRVPVLVAFLALLAIPVTGQVTIANSLADCKAGLGSPGNGEYPVDIVFSGISVFDRSNANYFSVRIPNLVNGRAVIKDGGGTIVRDKIKPHIAYILTDVQTAKPLIDAGLPVQPAFNESSCYVYYRLTDEIVTIDASSAPTSTNGTLCVTDAKPASSSNFCPDSASVGSMYWLPSFKNVVGAQTPEAQHFKDPDGTTIAGVVTVDRGYLQTVMNVPKKVWALKEKANDTETMRQAIAQEVHWHMRGTGTYFVVHLKKPNSTVDLSFTPQNGTGVVLYIFNSPIDETGPVKGTFMSPDWHFRAYYEFLANYDVKKGPLPFKSSKSCQNGSIGSNPSLALCVGCPNPDPSCVTRLAESGRTILSSDFKPKKKRSSKKSPSAHSGMGSTPGPVGQPVPSGLNCGSTQWP